MSGVYSLNLQVFKKNAAPALPQPKDSDTTPVTTKASSPTSVLPQNQEKPLSPTRLSKSDDISFHPADRGGSLMKRPADLFFTLRDFRAGMLLAATKELQAWLQCQIASIARPT